MAVGLVEYGTHKFNTISTISLNFSLSKNLKLFTSITVTLPYNININQGSYIFAFCT